MICNNCHQETDKGKFCTKCGEPLEEATEVENTETAATEEPAEPVVQEEQSEPSPAPVHQGQQAQQGEQVDFAEKTKEIGSSFGAFFLSALKKPSSAKNVTGTQYISGIIMIIVFALALSIEHFLYLKQGFSAEFFDDLAIPFFKYILLFAIILALIFGAVRVAAQDVTIQDILAKYGAYLVPFLLLFGVSVIFTLIDMTGLPFSTLAFITMSGPVLLIPVFILSEKAVKGFDYIYTAIVLILFSYIAYTYINNSINDISDNIFDNIPW